MPKADWRATDRCVYKNRCYTRRRPGGPRTLLNTKQTQIFFVSKLTISKVQKVRKTLQMNSKSSDFAELNRRCHSGSSRLRQIIFTNLRKAYLLYRTFRNIGNLLSQVKSSNWSLIYKALSSKLSGSFYLHLALWHLSSNALAGISAS